MLPNQNVSLQEEMIYEKIDQLRHDELGIDRARVFIVNKLKEKAYLWTQYEECYKCKFLMTKAIDPREGGLATKEFKTYYTPKFIINTNPDNAYANQVCSQASLDFKDQSQRILSIDDQSSCSWEVLEEGRSNTLTLVLTLIILVLLVAVFYGSRYFYRRFKKSDRVVEMESEKISQRLKSLDAFRGFSLISMIFVNYGSGRYHFIEHAEWDGMHFADFMFPFFVFIMGVTMAINLRSIIVKKDVPFKKVMIDIFLRSVKLFAVGFILNSIGNADIRYIRIPGVLQRFAVSYLFMASVHAFSLFINKHNLYSSLSYLSDIVPYWPDWILAAIMFIIYFSLTFGWKFDPNCPRGYIGPGGLYDNSSHVYCVGGAANKLDKLLFTDNHIYQYYTAAELYDPEEPDRQFKLSHDPEGLLGVTNSILLVFFGLQVGKILLTYSSTKQRLLRWSIWILVLSFFTGVLAGTSAIPINKNLWSFTFVTLTGATAILIFAMFYLLIDHLKWWPQGEPFQYPGMNSILLYIGHDFMTETFPFSFIGRSNSHAWQLIQNITAVLLWILISVYLYRRKIFFSL